MDWNAPFDAQPQPDPIDRGLVQLRAKFGDRMPSDVSRVAIRNMVTQSVQSWPEKLSAAYADLLLESVTIAVVARQINQEPALSAAELRAFMATGTLFFNSFVHP